MIRFPDTGVATTMSTSPAPNPEAIPVAPDAPICSEAEIRERSCRLFFTEVAGRRIEFFLVATGGGIQAWLNFCPHKRLPLNWRGSSCLTPDEGRVLCIVHAATFSPESGGMLSGPQSDDRQLVAVPIRIDNGAVLLADEETLAGLPDPWPDS